MSTLRRLDAELVRRRLARSREHARQLIDDGRVRVGGSPATKPATQVRDDVAIELSESGRVEYVSRGAHKLVGALDAFAAHGLGVVGRVALDAGASTGGFTQVLLERGAGKVIAVDVGYGQLAWQLQSDPRVVVRDRTNVRNLSASDLPFPPDLIVADLSFIGLEVVLPALVRIATPGADFVLMVKPQFEVGRARLGPGGVVRDPDLRREAVMGVARAAWELGLGTVAVVASPLPGPSGNVEYFLYLHHEAPAPEPAAVAAAVEEGPQ